MTTFLKKNGMDLALAAVVSPLASYGLLRMFPAPDAGFIVIASTAAICIRPTISGLGNQYASRLTSACGFYKEGKITNHIFHNLNALFVAGMSLLLPIFARVVGQRMGIQVPGYLQTVSYFYLAGSAVILSSRIMQIGLDVSQLF